MSRHGSVLRRFTKSVLILVYMHIRKIKFDPKGNTYILKMKVSSQTHLNGLLTF